MALLALVVLVAAPLGLNVAAMHAQWELSQLEAQQAELRADYQHLQAREADLSSLSVIEAKAEEAGLVEAPPRYLSLTGKAEVAQASSAEEPLP